MGYAQNAIAGFSWQTALKIAIAVVTILKISVLARLLTPADFGLFSLAMIALGISEATTQTGVNITILQSRHSITYFVDTAWVIAIVRGLVIGAIMLVLGLTMSNFLATQELLPLVTVASLIPVIKGFINPAIVNMQKQFAFFADSTYRFSLSFIDAIAAIALALVFQSVMALIVAMVLAAIAEVAISFFFFSTRPRFQYLKSRGDIILRNAKWLSFTSLFQYLHENLDNLLIGKLLSTGQLGLYHNAYSISHKLNYDVAKSASHGVLPALTKLSGQQARLRNAMLKSLGGVVVITTFASLPLLIFPEYAVTLLLGSQWLEVIPLLKWLVLAGLLQSATNIIYTFFVSQRVYAPVNLHLALTVVLMVALIIWLGSSYGLLGAVLAVLIPRVITLPVLLLPFKSLLDRK